MTRLEQAEARLRNGSIRSSAKPGDPSRRIVSIEVDNDREVNAAYLPALKRILRAVKKHDIDGSG